MSDKVRERERGRLSHSQLVGCQDLHEVSTIAIVEVEQEVLAIAIQTNVGQLSQAEEPSLFVL